MDNTIIYKEGIVIPKCKSKDGIHTLKVISNTALKRVERCLYCGLNIMWEYEKGGLK